MFPLNYLYFHGCLRGVFSLRCRFRVKTIILNTILLLSKEFIRREKYIKTSYSQNAWINMETYLMKHNNRKQQQKIPQSFSIGCRQIKEDQQPNFPDGQRAIRRFLAQKRICDSFQQVLCVQRGGKKFLLIISITAQQQTYYIY